MKNIVKPLTATILLAVLTSVNGLAQAKITTVEKLVANPSSYNEERVAIEGLVIQYVPTHSSTTGRYLLKGDYGGVINVITADAIPPTNQKFHVTGILFVDRENSRLVVCELSRSPLGAHARTP
jgi:hypothetical protein